MPELEELSGLFIIFVLNQKEMENIKEAIYVKGKEAIVVHLLLLIAIIVFLVPITLVLILRFIYRLVQTIREQAKIPEGVNANLENIY